jgi:hypothetical protein
MQNGETVWRVEPLDSYTNKFLCELLSAEDFCPNKLCSDGKEHGLWVCPHLTVERLNGSKLDAGLRYKIWVQEGQCGPIRPWRFERPKRKVVIAGYGSRDGLGRNKHPSLID